MALGTLGTPGTSGTCMRRLPLLAFALAAGLSVAACDIKTSANGDFSFDISGGKAEDTWSRTYKVPANGRFELINVNGRITAEQTDGTELIVEGRRSAKGRSDEAAKELLAKLEIREEAGESTIRVESRPPRLSGFSGHQIEWTIKVPKGVIIDLRTINGGVKVEGLEIAKDEQSNDFDRRRRLNGTMNGGGAKVNMSTTNGGVRLSRVSSKTS